jgi:hypothetical protein
VNFSFFWNDFVYLANSTPNFLDHSYRPKPFPFAGVFSILQSFCPRTSASNEQGFSIFPNGTYVLNIFSFELIAKIYSSSTDMLITIDRIAETNPFFRRNFSMIDIDSLPDMYETMIDRPAFIYDSLANLTYTLTKNLTTFCAFFHEQFNYTLDQCEQIIDHSVFDIRQVR